MFRYTKQDWTLLLSAVILFAAVLIYQGYQYGQGDQSQILPCIYAQDHPGSYAGDHYVNAYVQSRVNERTVFHFIFRYLGYQYAWVVFGWQVLLGVSLMLAWLKIAALGLKTLTYQCIAVALIFIVGFHTSVGSNEIYYNQVIPSLAAKTLASWGIYYWLKEEYGWWSGLLLAAGLLQPLVSIQLFIITAAAIFIQAIRKKKMAYVPWKKMVPYALIMLPWLFLLIRGNGGHEDPGFFMDIMEFRLSHHFFPDSFPWYHMIVGGIFAVVAIRFYRERLKWFMVIVAAGCLLYYVGVETYRLPIALYTQWWKTTIWLEAFALVAIAADIERQSISPPILSKFRFSIPVLVLVLVSVYRLSGFFGAPPDYMFPWTKKVSDEVDISMKAKALTPDQAVFIVPVEFTAFRWYSRRSSYVDYKAMLHQEDFLKTWYQRIQNIYAYGIGEKEAGFTIQNFSHNLLEEPTQISIEYWTSLGITHIISTRHDITSLKVLGNNAKYTIYALR